MRGTVAVSILLVLATLTALSQAAQHAETPAFMEVFIKGRSRAQSGLSQGEPLTPEPRCGRDFGGKKCSDKDVGRFGECCSKWGFCGKKPYHCVPRLGCQSECNSDLDQRYEDPNRQEERPIAVEPAPNEGAGPQVIIKTIQYAIPLCEDCKKPEPQPATPPPAPANKLPPNALNALVKAATLQVLGAPPKSVFTTADGERASGVPIPPSAQRKHDLSGKGSGETDNEQDVQKAYARQVRELRALTRDAKRKAKQILKKAKNLAKKLHKRRQLRAKKRAGHYRRIIVRDFTPPRKLKLILDKGDPKDPRNPNGY